jgi:hypothetical protein
MLTWKKTLTLAVTTLVSLAAATSGAMAQNPVIFDSGNKVQGIDYDPWTNQTRIRIDQTRIRDSALNPSRGKVDRGSMQYVKKPLFNSVGQHIGYEEGWTWTSNGVPHGDLKRTTVSDLGGGLSVQKDDRMIYAKNPMAGSSAKPATKPTPRPRSPRP